MVCNFAVCVRIGQSTAYNAYDAINGMRHCYKRRYLYFVSFDRYQEVIVIQTLCDKTAQ